MIGQTQTSRDPEKLRCHGYGERRFVLAAVSERREVEEVTSESRRRYTVVNNVRKKKKRTYAVKNVNLWTFVNVNVKLRAFCGTFHPWKR